MNRSSRRHAMRNGEAFEASLFELIRRTSVDLPADIEAVLRVAKDREERGSLAHDTLATILENIKLARKNDGPLCQDTGALSFTVQAPLGSNTSLFTTAASAAVSAATRAGYLRQNTIDSVTGEPYPVNLASGSPGFFIEQSARETYDVRLLMKGGGSENVSRQYSLPDESIGAGRDLEGVRRCVLDAVVRAQGNGCAPGVLGVCIGGDRGSGFKCAKEQFLRRLDDESPVEALTELETRIMQDANQLGIGPMGMGGRTTILAVKVGALSRVPASFFVSVAYMCWAFRRRGVLLDAGGGIKRWLY